MSRRDPKRGRWRREFPNSPTGARIPEKPTFKVWLNYQFHRPDAIGYLARLYISDECWPRAQHYQVFADHIVETHNAPMMDVLALRSAWREWRAIDATPMPNGPKTDS